MNRFCDIFLDDYTLLYFLRAVIANKGYMRYTALRRGDDIPWEFIRCTVLRMDDDIPWKYMRYTALRRNDDIPWEFMRYTALRRGDDMPWETIRGFRRELHPSNEGGHLFEPPRLLGGELCRSPSGLAGAASRKRSLFPRHIIDHMQSVPLQYCVIIAKANMNAIM